MNKCELSLCMTNMWLLTSFFESYTKFPFFSYIVCFIPKMTNIFEFYRLISWSIMRIMNVSRKLWLISKIITKFQKLWKCIDLRCVKTNDIFRKRCPWFGGLGPKSRLFLNFSLITINQKLIMMNLRFIIFFKMAHWVGQK